MINTENTGLILVDIQGKLARTVYQSNILIANIEKLVKGCQILQIPIVWLEQYPKGLGNTVPELSNLLDGQKPIEKRFFNAMEEETVRNAVTASNKQNWIVCGIEAHICVYQTAMGLLERDFNVEVPVDCISSRKEDSIKVAIDKFIQKGIGVTNLEMCLYELVKDSRTEGFKRILPLVK